MPLYRWLRERRLIPAIEVWTPRKLKIRPRQARDAPRQATGGARRAQSYPRQAQTGTRPTQDRPQCFETGSGQPKTGPHWHRRQDENVTWSCKVTVWHPKPFRMAYISGPRQSMTCLRQARMAQDYPKTAPNRYI